MTKAIARDPIYRRRRFRPEIIELCVRWYLTYRLSYRDLVEMMAEQGAAGQMIDTDSVEVICCKHGWPPGKQSQTPLSLTTTLPLARPASTYAKASLVASNGNTRSITGRIAPASMRRVISNS